jgi:hypothetical protein
LSSQLIVGKANYPEQKEITFEIDRTYPKGTVEQKFAAPPWH